MFSAAYYNKIYVILLLNSIRFSILFFFCNNIIRTNKTKNLKLLSAIKKIRVTFKPAKIKEGCNILKIIGNYGNRII